MAREGWRKLTLTIVMFIVLALASGWMVTEAEGRVCYRRSRTFKGRCSTEDECMMDCDGYCINGACSCPVPC